MLAGRYQNGSSKKKGGIPKLAHTNGVDNLRKQEVTANE
jgi:hypothetical protein